MDSEKSLKLYNDLGVKPVINALGGNMTLLGGSILSPKVSEAMELANRYYVQMEELLDKTGEIIAEYFGAEAAYVTPGCAAALALGAAACMAGNDNEKIEQLPDVTGIKHEIIVQKRLRYKYDRCLTVPGAKLVEVGDDSGTTAEQIEAAIGSNTVAITHFAPGVAAGVVPLEEVIKIGKKHGVPIIVDAAAQIYPIEIFPKYTGMGADLVCYGAKYFGAPHSAGILCGRKDLVESAKRQGFIGFEASPYRSFGRPLKLDRQEIIGVVIAIQEWVAMDHEARFANYDKRVKNLQKGFEGVANVEATPQPENGPAQNLRLTLDETALGKTAADIANTLKEGNPRILVHTNANTINISTRAIVDGDEPVIADRIKSLL
ncbi:aminotransferase class V-fold PLP-dependent enzyme [bacterium]|nr:aminotransferase class V-fold PLP-dependent enzyme [bacterium]